jgi:tripeptide aminopeptidase
LALPSLFQKFNLQFSIFNLQFFYLPIPVFYFYRPATTGMENVPVLGFIAHMDTAPDASGKNVNPRIVKNYDGKDIPLNADTVMQTSYFPELLNHVGEDLIVTDGTTLLGADDKAGIAEIISAMMYLKEHPEIKHGKVRIAFNPDEEIGMGAHHFNVELFGCDWAYTMDGGEVGELEFENFNAASAKISFKGTNVHQAPPRVRWSMPPCWRWSLPSNCPRRSVRSIPKGTRASTT